MPFPLGSFTDGLFSGAQNTIQLMGEVQKYQENSATFEDRAKAYRDAVAANQPQGTQPAQPSTALPSAPVPKVDTPIDPNAPTLTPPIPPGGQTPPAPAPSVTPPPTAPPTPTPPPVMQKPSDYDIPPSAPPPPGGYGAPVPPPASTTAPGKTSALGGTAYTGAGQTQTADASGGKSYTSDAPLVYLPPGQFTAQVRGQASQAQTGQRPPPSQVTALAGNFPTVGRA